MNKPFIKDWDLEAWVKTTLMEHETKLPKYLSRRLAEQRLLTYIKNTLPTAKDNQYDTDQLQTVLENWFQAQPDTNDIRLDKNGHINYIPKQTMLKNHRSLWNWMAEETKRRKTIVDKENYIDEINPIIGQLEAQCWPCEYTAEDNCTNCPFAWGNSDTSTCISADNTEGLYNKWRHTNSWEKAAKYAEQIANLDEK